MRSLRVLYIFVLGTGKLATFVSDEVGFPVRNANLYKNHKLLRAIFSVFLLHFATKLCNFTHFKTMEEI